MKRFGLILLTVLLGTGSVLALSQKADAFLSDWDRDRHDRDRWGGRDEWRDRDHGRGHDEWRGRDRWGGRDHDRDRWGGRNEWRDHGHGEWRDRRW